MAHTGVVTEVAALAGKFHSVVRDTENHNDKTKKETNTHAEATGTTILMRGRAF